MDIDVYEQLVPNGLTMITQLCSTAILFLLMWKLLYKRVSAWFEARSEKMQQDLTDSEKARTEALKDREEAQAQLQAASGKAEEIVSAAVKEASQQRDDILADAKKEADLTRQKAREDIEADRRKMAGQMQKEMVDVAMDAAARLMGTQDLSRLDQQAVENFVKEAQSDGF